MGRRELDKEFKDQLRTGRSFEPSDDNWKAAAAMLDKELPVAASKGFTNRFTFMWIGLIAILSGIGGYLYLNTPNPATNSKPTEQISNTQQSKEVIQPATTLEVDQNKTTNTEAPETNLDQVEGDFAINSTSNNSSIHKEDTPAGSDPTVNQEPVQATAQSNTNEALNLEPEAFSERTATTKTNTLYSAPVSITSSPTQQNQLNKTKNAEEQKEDPNNIAETIATSAIISNENIDNGQSIPDQPTNYTEQINDEKSAEIPEETKSFETENHQTSPADESASEIKKEGTISTPRRVSRNHYFKVGFEAGVFSTNRSLTTTDIDCQPYVLKRNNEESLKPSFAFNLNFGQQIDQFNWQVGLGYLSYQENINYNGEVLEEQLIDNGYWDFKTYTDTILQGTWVIDSINAGHWDIDTTLQQVTDTVYIEDWDTSFVSIYDSTLQANNGTHTLSYFEVPVFVGYTLGKKNWKVDIQPGFSVGFLTQSNGARYMRKDLTGLQPTNNIEQFNSILWKLHFRIGIRYALKDFDIGLYPHYNYTLNNVLNNKAVEQKFGNFGASIGVYYKF
ncbi:MAG: outer membrane beta-barrel protein [Schleiferiaceae bacterium]|nr:outer membrane beta-barrel protein [Schleiferiaceae bacterium]